MTQSKKTTPNKRGRKNQYETLVRPRLGEFPQWMADGLTEEMISQKCGVGYSTFQRYKIEFEELRGAIIEAHQKKHSALYNALYKRATGHEHTEKKVITSTEGGIARIEKTVKYYPPSEKALIYYLEAVMGRNQRAEMIRQANAIREKEGKTPMEIGRMIEEQGWEIPKTLELEIRKELDVGLLDPRSSIIFDGYTVK